MRIILFSWLAALFVNHSEVRTIKFSGSAQGTSYHITYYATDTLVTKSQVDSIFQNIDSSLSLYKPYSLVNRFNQSVNGLSVDDHMYQVVSKAIKVHRVSNGFFDITVYPLTEAWGFGVTRVDSTPSPATVQQLKSCVNSKLITFKKRKLVKKKACVKLDPNGIAQGYTVDVVADFFERAGVKDFIIELGGEIRVAGRKPGGEKMSLGIESPGSEPGFSMINKVVYLDKGALTTSGNYQRYYESGGKIVNHLLDPKTGYYVQNDLVSVTVYAKDAITADAYDNAIMAMGLVKGLRFAEKHRDIAVHFIYRKADGVVADTMSKRFKTLLNP